MLIQALFGDLRHFGASQQHHIVSSMIKLEISRCQWITIAGRFLFLAG